jgi:hypothetical protein
MQAQVSKEGEPFSNPIFDEEVAKIRAGKSGGQTFNTDGTLFAPENPKVDLVSLVSVNLPRKDVSIDAVRSALGAMGELLNEPNVAAGLFAFKDDKTGKDMVSVDVNAVVPKDYRKNTMAFAKDNDQISIWDWEKALKDPNGNGEVKTGGSGKTRIDALQEALETLDLLSEGRPVDVDEIKKEYGRGAVAEQQVMEGVGAFKPYERRKLAVMTNTELEQHFPEAKVVRRVRVVGEDGTVRRKEQVITSDITESPLYKQAGGSEEKAVELFANRMVKYLEPLRDLQAFKDGATWYSGFAPRLKKALGKWSQEFAELLAATSPQTDPQQNFQYAYEALRSWQDGRFDKIIKKYDEGFAKVVDGSWSDWLETQRKAGKLDPRTARVQNPSSATFLAEWVTRYKLKPRQLNEKRYGQHSDALLQVFTRRWLDQNAGPKTRNFVENLLGISHGATIDLWADRTMRRMGYEGFEDHWRILPKNQGGVRDVDLAFAQKVFEAAAKKMDMKADDLQGAAWFAEKMNWAKEGWGRLDLGDYRKEMDRMPQLEQKYQHGQKAAKETRKVEKKAGKAAQEEMDFLDLVKPRPMK